MNNQSAAKAGWAKKNPEKRRAIQRRFYEKHGAKIQAERRAYRARNRARLIAMKKAWDKANPDLVSMQRVRKRLRLMNQKMDASFRRHYSFALADYNKMLESQGCVCAICKQLNVTKRSPRLVVDHDHKSGKIRGLLCHRCNCGLGYFKDDLGLLQGAAEYLKRSQWADE